VLQLPFKQLMKVQRANLGADLGGGPDYEAAGCQQIRTFEQVEYVVGMGERPEPCVSDPADNKKEREGESYMHLNLPEESMLGKVADSKPVSDCMMQVQLPVDDESMSSSSRGSSKLRPGEEYLRELAAGRDRSESLIDRSSLVKGDYGGYEEEKVERVFDEEEVEIPPEDQNNGAQAQQHDAQFHEYM